MDTLPFSRRDISQALLRLLNRADSIYKVTPVPAQPHRYWLYHSGALLVVLRRRRLRRGVRRHTGTGWKIELQLRQEPELTLRVELHSHTAGMLYSREHNLADPDCFEKITGWIDATLCALIGPVLEAGHDRAPSQRR